MSELSAVEMILAKRAGQEHSPEQIERLIGAYTGGDVPDYQVSAWLMAICWRGMTNAETAALTVAMANSGERLDLSSFSNSLDKHSTGGVGDKTTLVVAPLLAVMGGTVAKMSGRGLGHTGGTIDKLESIPGYRAALTDNEFYEQARKVGVVVAGQSRDLAPADGLLYALRDATGTVESLPLIASSVMSKKLAGGSASLVLDVKVGAGAFMKNAADARELAQLMVNIGARAGLNARAVLSSMDQPLGLMVGNALEVEEAAACLRGEGPSDLTELSLKLALELLGAAGMTAGRAALEEALGSGRAYEKFEEWIAAQQGDVRALKRLERAPDRTPIVAPSGGYIGAINALKVGMAAGVVGAGRLRKGDAVDHAVGVELHAKVGEPVREGARVMTLHHRGERGVEAALELLRSALSVSEEPVSAPPLILDRGITGAA